MISVGELLARFKTAGLDVWLDGEQIRFRARPGLERVADRLAALKLRRTEVVAHLRDLEPVRALPPLRAQSRSERIPLSQSQRRWMHRPGEPTFPDDERCPIIFHLVGRLNLHMLERALSAVIDRHEILRTSYHWDGESVHQQVAEPMDYPLKVYDLTLLPASDQPERLHQILKSMYGEDARLDQPRMVDVRLFRVGAKDHYLGGFINHVALDNRSVGIFGDEVFSLYKLATLGLPGGPPPLRIQFADFALWEASWMTSARLQANARHWEERLADVGPLALAGEPSVARTRSPIAGVYFSIAGEEWRGVVEFARRYGLTPTMVFTASFCACLAKLTRQARVAPAFVVKGRPSGADDLIGSFIQSRPFCIDIGSDPTVLELMDQAKRSLRDVVDLRLAVPEHIMRRLNLGNVTINISSADSVKSSAGAKCAGLDIELCQVHRPLRTHITRDLQISLSHLPHALEGYFAYASGRCAEEAIRWLAEATAEIMAQAILTPSERLSALWPEKQAPTGSYAESPLEVKAPEGPVS